MLTVAIGAESIDYDAEIYRALIEILLATSVVRYSTNHTFNGWRSVLSLSDAYLRDADNNGVKHALFAIDNDGGAKEHLEHDPLHHAVAEAVSKTGCRACLLAESMPTWWLQNARKRCVVVPVQALETWLLCIRGDAFTAPSPEQQYYPGAVAFTRASASAAVALGTPRARSRSTRMVLAYPTPSSSATGWNRSLATRAQRCSSSSREAIRTPFASDQRVKLAECGTSVRSSDCWYEIRIE